MAYLYDRFNVEVDAENSTGSKFIDLEFIRTDASNISLEPINSTVPRSNKFGINGGFFDGNLQLLSIAVNNDDPVYGLPDEPGGGWSQAAPGGAGRGTVRWDGASDVAGVFVVNNVRQLIVTNRNSYWAQGGVSMNLGISTLGEWENSISSERPDRFDWKASRPRSGLVYEVTGPSESRTTDVFLVITRTGATLWEFREAIKKRIPTARDGIFLDGGGSTQINCRESSYVAQERTIPQMIALVQT